MATKKKTATKKRNPQDATRARDVAPVRRRVAVLEKGFQTLTKTVRQIVADVAALKRTLG